MRNILLAVVFLISVVGCVTVGDKVVYVEDNEYYVQYSFFYKNDMTSSSNYREGTLIPINTKVRLQNIGGYDIFGEKSFEIVTVDGRHRIVVGNNEDTSGVNLEQFKNRMLKKEPVSLSEYTEQVQSFIRNGEPAKGMTKEMVLLAMGYPPYDLTPSLEEQNWIYKQAMFQKAYLIFNDSGILIDLFYK